MSIGDICSRFSSGKAIAASCVKNKGLYPVYGGNGLRGYTDIYNFEGECAIIGRQGAYCGNVRYFKGKAYMTEHAIVACSKEKYNIGYIAYLLSIMHLEQYQGQSAQPGLSVNTLSKVKVLLPNKKIQDSVFRILQSFECKIENNKKINVELESMARTIYDYWFLQFDFPNENGKPYRSSGGKMVWNEELKREIPEGWNTTILQNIAECLDSYRVPLSSAERAGKNGNIPYYGATGIVDYVDESIFDGDYILMAEDGSVMDEKGNPILQRITGKAWVNNHAHVLRPIKNHGCKLLMMLLKDVQVMKIKTGSIQMKINQENMNKIVLPEIPEKLVDSINMILNNIDTQILHKEKENQELTFLRDFLLPLLMNGQVVFKF